MRNDFERGRGGGSARAALLLLACSVWTGCPGSDGPDAAAWRQQDLWLAAPEMRRGRFKTYQGRSLRSLPERPGEVIRFELGIGAVPHFSFRPITEKGTACRFAVFFEDVTGKSHRLFTGVHHSKGRTLPRTIDVDLRAHAGEPGELALEVTAPPGEECRAHWGSPRVVDAVALKGEPTFERPHVLLLVADTLRADALGAYGRTPSVTPVLDAFATESQVWLHAFATVNNTNPSLASLMTGLYPKDHGLFDLRTRLPRSHTTLSEHFQAAGYATLGVAAASHVWNAGLNQGFDRFVRPGGQFFAETVVDLAIDWFQVERDQPTFAWLHFFDPHVPHNPPADYAEGFAPARATGMAPFDEWKPFREPGVVEFDSRAPKYSPGHRKLYPGEVAYLDRQLGRLLDFLRSRGRLDSTIVALVADHGETLGERGAWFRHTGLYDETTHVPLMIRWPGAKPRGRIDGLVQHFDLFPTLLAAIGVTADSDARLLDDAPSRDAVFASHANDQGHMIRTKQHLFVHERATRRRPRGSKLYDLAADPRAHRDLSGGDDPVKAQLAARLGEWRATKRDTEPAESVQLDDAERERLRALGYGE